MSAHHSKRGLPKKQRVAAYAVIVRDGQILLSRLAPWLSDTERWTLPGGGIDHGEHPREGVVREIYEEAGLRAQVGETARVFSFHDPERNHRDGDWDFHGLRLVFEGWVPADSPPPRVMETDGSTVDAQWIDLEDVRSGARPVVPLVWEALAAHEPHVLQRVAVYGIAQRRDRTEVLLTRISRYGYGAGYWTLPGGGIEQGEAPDVALVREFAEETGLAVDVGGLLGVHHEHVQGLAPSGRWEDFHGVHLMYAADVAADAEPVVVEAHGTTDACAWVPWADVLSEARPVFDLVRAAYDVSR